MYKNSFPLVVKQINFRHLFLYSNLVFEEKKRKKRIKITEKTL